MTKPRPSADDEARLARLRAELEQWTEQVRRWESQVGALQGELRVLYDSHLADWRREQANAVRTLDLLRGPMGKSEDVGRSTEESRRRLAEVFDQARVRFEKIPPGRAER
jgi:multidrug resistance efflux pump